AKLTATLSVATVVVRSSTKWLSGRSTFRRTHSWATRMSRLRTGLYLVAMFALLAAMFGSLASPVQADDGGHHHGDDHKGDEHKKDKPAPDPTDPPPTFEVTPTRLPTDTPEPTGTTPPPLEATAT